MKESWTIRCCLVFLTMSLSRQSNVVSRQLEKGMKRAFIILSALGILAFMSGPAYALKGIDDSVPGSDILQPFFLVSIPGQGTLDTLIVLTEIGGKSGYEAGKTKGYVHFKIFDKDSVHRGDYSFPYTPNDVLPYSVLYLLRTWLFTNGLPTLEIDLDGDGVNDHYAGYIYWNNSLDTANNLIAHLYLIDLSGGQAAGVNVAAKEYAPSSAGYDPRQNVTNDDGVEYEAFSADALAVSGFRERNDAVPASGLHADGFRIMPRYFLIDGNSKTYFIIWTSKTPFALAKDVNSLGAMIYDESETAVSGSIPLLYELNIVDVADCLPSSWTPPIGGWFDAEVPHYSGWYADEFLAYSWQSADSTSTGLNWSVLFKVSRDVEGF